MPMKRLQKSLIPPPVPDRPATEHPRRIATFWWRLGLSFAGALLIVAGLLTFRVLGALNTAANGNDRLSAVAQLTHLVTSRDAELRGEAQDRVNILLLGMGGQGHDGPLLTDTIILASLKPSTGQIALLSIPRDLAVEIPKYGVRKINNANAFGQDQDYPGGGEQLAADIVSTVTGQTIHYFARIDFAGFVKIVDDLGGVTITVERDFVDREYPTEDYGYQTIRFTAGAQMMKGATALTYVRSRHGSNGEGSDFARSRRQQLVLEAVRDKAFSLGTVLNPLRIGSIISSLGSHTRTNAEAWELLRIAKLVREANANEIVNQVLDNSPTGPLRAATGIDGAFLLVPKDGTFATVKRIVAELFTRPLVEREAARLTLIDESGRVGTAKQVADAVQSLGIPAPKIAAARTPKTTRPTTQIYDLSSSRVPFTLRNLEAFFGIVGTTTRSIVSPLDYADALVDLKNLNTATTSPTQPETSDLLVILGQDALTRVTDVSAGTRTTTNQNTNTNRNAPTNVNANRNGNSNSSTKTNSNQNFNTNGNVNGNVNTNSSVNGNTNSAPTPVPLNSNAPIL